MNSATEQGLAEPHLRQVLAGAGLDVEYVRAEGNTLYLRDDNGTEVPVLDLAGGYGSLMFGHNPPQIVEYAREILAQGTPVHTQFSRHSHANDVAVALNRIVRREQATHANGGKPVEDYLAIFASTGAEAIEAAVKHAEFDRVLRLQAIGEEIAAHAEEARAAVREGRAEADGGAAGLEERIAGIEASNAALMTRPPLFLTLEGSFHGKLMGSGQLTHNEGYRVPFRGLGAQSRFVPLNDAGALAKVVAGEAASLLDVAVRDGRVVVVERPFPVFCAFLVEPIQGEGGIHAVTPEFVLELHRVCDEIGCPVIVDEIQSGMGRTGAFLASTHVGLRGDYYALAKSLGGGIAKASVMLVRRDHYREQFELLHSSTFAKDGFSTLIAAKVLDMMEADSGGVYRLAAERGDRLRATLEAVRADYPDVVKDVRGRGLMQGLEFHDQSGSSAGPLSEMAQNGLFGYLVAGHLLNGHRVRTFPTASAANTLRFEPSVLLTDAETGLLESALRDICEIIRDQDAQRLVLSQ
ncbi:aminotransferase class III-fold pyridoxal phosphate-dependent enzyme [Streptomyces sp. TRM 70351]|uniref:aspartate aminotransferase family protein n=1 Tax=Streptomyces sp. TRM 70351 TaxID=3116552 RepID=UPI002E7B98F8|nr:aminotransferase class III-fold pyridoxal phosphate-dependent enzyme [Streptomyces sp. TRM 70351]MEE1929752.1 aminotransferase class III-fold pyridoxal phosphate-dependent enzyme [Streptomyces sp. TRM 70351]